MIRGLVNSELEAELSLSVADARGVSHGFRAIIDTGFSGFLTLPQAVIADLELAWVCRQNGMLADGSVVVFDVFAAALNWNDRVLEIEVESADTAPLVGMSMLRGHRITIDVLPAGDVAIEQV